MRLSSGVRGVAACAVIGVVAAALTAGAAGRSQSLAAALDGTHQRHLCNVPQRDTVMCDAISFARSDGAFVKLANSAIPREHDGSVAPALTANSINAMTPGRLAQAYSLPTTTAGSGRQTIGIVDAYDNPWLVDDLRYFNDQFGLPQLPNCSSTVTTSCLLKVNQRGKVGGYVPVDVGWAVEIALDVEAAHAICRNCRIVLVEADSAQVSDIAAAVNMAVALGATVVSNSYGAPESALSSGFYSLYGPAYRHAGIPVTAASGDSGWGAQFPADAPGVVAVGGTTLSTDPNTGARLGETVWWDGAGSGTGSGCSRFGEARPAQAATTGWSATGCAARRGLNDVAADADPYSGLYVRIASSWWVVGGTSLSAPLVAGMYALAANPTSATYPADIPYAHTSNFHDVTSGSNTSSSCPTTMCRAAAGYDGPTGVGTPNGISGFVVTPMPSVASFSPTSAAVGAMISVSGQHLTGTTHVWVNGIPASFSVRSDSLVTFTVPPGATSGAVDLQTPGGTARVGSLIVIPAPTITSFKPATARIGATVVVSGTNFMNVSAVTLAGLGVSFTVNSPTSVAFTVPGGATSGRVVVTTPGGTATSAGDFVVVAPPSITSFAPASAPVGATVTVTGTFLTGTTAVKLGSTSASFAVGSPTALTFTVPNGATSAKITVSTPNGSVTTATKFVVALPPTITSFSPASAGVGAPVVVTGTNFTGVTHVVLHGVDVPFVVSSTTTVKFNVPDGATTGMIKVTTPAGTATSATSFAVVPAPAISSFTPASGPVGTTVTVTGTNFTGATKVTLNGASVTFTVLSATSIRFTVPVGASNGRIVVTTPGGTARSATGYKVT